MMHVPRDVRCRLLAALCRLRPHDSQADCSLLAAESELQSLFTAAAIGDHRVRTKAGSGTSNSHDK